jgi:hypothetical protein
MKALNEYVAQKNAWGKIFGSAPMSLSSAQDRKQIAQHIDSELSPENLHCDGEISHAEAMRKYKRLATVAKQLQKLDPSVQIYEL